MFFFKKQIETDIFTLLAMVKGVNLNVAIRHVWSPIHFFTTYAFTYMVSLFLRGPPYGMKGRLPVAAW